MKFGGIIMITVLLQLSLSGQSQTLSFSGKNVPLKEIFTIIKTQTGVVFFYDAALLQDAKPVTINWKNVTLQTALNEIFKEQPLAWLLEGKTVTLIKRSVQVTPPTAVAPPPQIRVRGSITDVEGNPIPGVSVTIKGTRQGTVADDAGAFSILTDHKNVLAFSSVNYIPKEVKVERGEMNIKLQLDVKPMESFLVGGNMNAVKRKSVATSVTVLDSKTLEKIPVNTLDQVFRGWVPGTHSFNPGDKKEGFPTLMIRGAGGATSLSAVSVYIDGIEYSGGSGYLFQLDKNNIDRIEIVRGPGAATLYGTGSNGGIVQVFTKKSRRGQSSVNLTSSAGFYKSKWVKNDPFQQMHNLETMTGFKNVSIKLGGSYRTGGAYLPDGGEKNKGFYAGARFNIGKLQANIMGRYNVRNFHHSRPPYYDTATHPRTDLIIEPVPGNRAPIYVWFNVRPTAPRNKDAITESSISGINLNHRTTENWVNNIDAGYTMNHTREVPVQDGTIPLQSQYSSEKYQITTIRYFNVLTLENIGKGFAAVISSGAEYKKFSFSSSFTRATAATTVNRKQPDNENYGAFVQANPSYKNVYLTLGLRYEKNNLFKAAWNPRIGLTTNFEIKSLTIKPRISWGKGITSPTYEHRFGAVPTNISVVYGNPDIKPQSQQGFDYGIEVYDIKGKYKFEAVYYDNILKDMIGQQSLGSTSSDPGLQRYMYINVGKVANTGWEFSGEYRVRRFNLQGTFSVMNTVLKDTTGSYILPQLRRLAPGERLNLLPRHVAGFSITYNFFKIFAKADKGAVSFNVTEFDGVNYRDGITYALDVSYGRTPYTPGITSYAAKSSPVFRLGLYGDYNIVRDLRVFIQGSNILNDYTYEYNATPIHGATWLFGFKYNFSESK
jgi:outer membrane receptor protein involved in Fe transport